MIDTIFFSLAVLLSSIISGMTGLGGGILLLAFMTPVFPAPVLIPLHGIVQLLSNTSRVILSYKKVNYRIFILFALGAALGSLLGSPVTIKIPDIFSTIILAFAILFFTWIPKMTKAIEFKGKFVFIQLWSHKYFLLYRQSKF